MNEQLSQDHKYKWKNTYTILIIIALIFFIGLITALGFGQNNIFTALTSEVPIEQISFLNWLAPNADKFLENRKDVPAFPFKGINSYNYFQKGSFENEPRVNLQYFDNNVNFINSKKYTFQIENNGNNLLGNYHLYVGFNDYNKEFKKSFFDILYTTLNQYASFDLGTDKIQEIKKMMATLSVIKKDNPTSYEIPQDIITKLDLQNLAATSNDDVEFISFVNSCSFEILKSEYANDSKLNIINRYSNRGDYPRQGISYIVIKSSLTNLGALDLIDKNICKIDDKFSDLNRNKLKDLTFGAEINRSFNSSNSRFEYTYVTVSPKHPDFYFDTRVNPGSSYDFVYRNFN